MGDKFYLLLDSNARLFDGLETALRTMREECRLSDTVARCFELQEVFNTNDLDVQSIRKLEPYDAAR